MTLAAHVDSRAEDLVKNPDFDVSLINTWSYEHVRQLLTDEFITSISSYSMDRCAVSDTYRDTTNHLVAEFIMSISSYGMDRCAIAGKMSDKMAHTFERSGSLDATSLYRTALHVYPNPEDFKDAFIRSLNHYYGVKSPSYRAFIALSAIIS
jgi:hypothetical protein